MPASPSLRKLFAVWLSLGFQSFGGGFATLTLIKRAVVDEQKWITDEDFTRFWSLCQLSPGINLLGLTILIGRQLRGISGIVLALVGLLLPSCVITVVITAFYARFQHLAVMRAALRGIVPATVGLGFLTAYQLGATMLAAARREGRGSLTASVVLLIGSGAVALISSVPIAAILCAGGLIGAAYAGRRRAPG